ncbi:helix-turn-helix domain-containing protein [Nocardiopsis valliformis]|uniref:helix-turn-helix domain-containing protein n=1 Tax=Nocardiopsis valliformis TaxID=239974 RepID=UPI00034BA23B|nr:helix-turn-helix transcriptional regulator [Nocardiopsis valliformis]
MGQPAASVARRIVARVMRDARVRQGFTVTKAASIAGFTQGTLTKYERAENPFPKVVVYRLADLYGIDQDIRDKLVELAGQKELGWWQRHREIPEWFESYIGLETEAHTVSNYEDGLIPGLLQTEDYARAVLSTDVDAGPEEQVEAHVTVRMERQKRLTSENPLRFNAVINESALYRAVGSAEVMRNQLAALLERAELPNVDLRVLPFEVGAHYGSEGSFVIMQFPDVLPNVSFEDVVLVEYRAGALYLEKDHEVELFSQIFQRAQGQCLNPEESVKRIQRVRSERFEE